MQRTCTCEEFETVKVCVGVDVRTSVHHAKRTIMQSLVRPCLRTARPCRRVPAPVRHASTQYTTSSRNFRLTPTTAVLCFVPVLTGVLGVWQLQRLQWKLGLIDEVDEAMAKDPMILPDEIK